MSFAIRYHHSVVERDLPGISKGPRKRILAAIGNKLADQPVVFGKPLRTPLFPARSLRVGDYRIVYTVEAKTVIILAVGHRKSIYKLVEGR